MKGSRKKLLIIISTILFVMGIAGVASAIPTDGLVGHYTFSGNANDSSGYNNHGTLMPLTGLIGLAGVGRKNFKK